MTETNPLLNGSLYHRQKREIVPLEKLTSKDVVVATRLRLTSDFSYHGYHISYLHATVNGVQSEILLPTDIIYKKTWKSELIQMCKKQKVFIKDLLSSHVVSVG